MADKGAERGFSEGLEDVVAAESAICTVDGRAGRLIYRGIDIGELATRSTFEEVSYLLWFGALPTAAQLEEFTRELTAGRELPAGLLPVLNALPRQTPPMDALRTAVSAMAHFDPDVADSSAEANRRKAIRVMARVPVLVAAQHHIRAGQSPLAPRTDLSQAAHFLYLLSGKEPTEDQARALDIALILHADHEFNASTFAARVTAATLSDLHSAMTTAIGTLKGPLHGGANENVMRMLQSIGPDADGVRFVEAEFAQGRKIPGFGHRVYRTWDPRALVLREMACPVPTDAFRSVYCRVAAEIEEAVIVRKKLYPNVDFYSAPLYDNLGVPFELFTPLFAISRTAGWLAHILEQYANNRLIRPRAYYTGPQDVPFVPIEDRRGNAGGKVEAAA